MATLAAAAPTIIGGIGALKSMNKSPAKPPPAIPMPDEEALKLQQRRKFASMGNSGRASTILTDTGGLG